MSCIIAKSDSRCVETMVPCVERTLVEVMWKYGRGTALTIVDFRSSFV